MAAVDAPVASRLKGSKSYEATMDAVHHEAAFNLDQLLLLGGTGAAVALWVIAFLNVVGTLNIQVRPGEGAGINPAIDFGVFGLFALMAPYGFLVSAKIGRIKRIEDRLPDFLRDVAEAGRFGMTLPEAIIVASKGRYGLLTEEIKKMASQLEWGVPVATALQLFEERVPTPLVQRVVSIVTRANEAGGNVADVLSMVAHDTREVQLSQAARQISMLTYVTVIYISFFVFLVTIYIMAAVFLPQMVTAGNGIAASGVAQGGVTLNSALVPELFIIFLVAVIVHAVGDGIMAGILFNGKVATGMQHAVIMLITGWAIMRFVVPVLNG
ncbi:MAG: type II secretion system F family protein [Thermoplasmata archaeon]